MRTKSLEEYTRGKFDEKQLAELHAALQHNRAILVAGVYQGHIEEYLTSKGLTEVGRSRRPHKTEKQFNRERPVLLKVRGMVPEGDSLLLCVFPSREYVLQYAQLTVELLAAKAATDGLKVEDWFERVRCVHHPNASRALPEWSGLVDGLRNRVQKGDLAILGHVELLSEYFLEHDWRRERDWESFGARSMFGIAVHSSDVYGRAVLLGVRESYWGSAAAQVARCLVDAGASHVVYAAKMGVLSTPEKIHEFLSPKRFLIWNGREKGRGGAVREVSCRESPMHVIPAVRDYVTGAHLSVPTVVGETYAQRRDYRDQGPVSIDNEISYIADELSQTTADFTAIHFVTDYVRNEFSKEYEAPYDLAKNSPDVANAKAEQFRRIAGLIATFAMFRRGHGNNQNGAEGCVTDLCGAWMSGYQSLDDPCRPWVEEAVQIRYEAGALRLTNGENSRGYPYVFTAQLYGDSLFYGTYLGTRDVSHEHGVAMLQISGDRRRIAGYWCGPSVTGATQFVPWVLAKHRDDLAQAKRELASATLGVFGEHHEAQGQRHAASAEEVCD